jgi:hypothetical protein
VCEFTCSCCRPIVAAAADTLVAFLCSREGDDDGGAEQLRGFAACGGVHALKVGLASADAAVVCACIRVLAALACTLRTHELAHGRMCAEGCAAPCQCGASNLQQQQKQEKNHQQQNQNMEEQNQHQGQQQEVLPVTPAWLDPHPASECIPMLTCEADINCLGSSWGTLCSLAELAGAQQRPSAVRLVALQELHQAALIPLLGALDATGCSPLRTSWSRNRSIVDAMLVAALHAGAAALRSSNTALHR